MIGFTITMLVVSGVLVALSGLVWMETRDDARKRDEIADSERPTPGEDRLQRHLDPVGAIGRHHSRCTWIPARAGVEAGRRRGPVLSQSSSESSTHRQAVTDDERH